MAPKYGSQTEMGLNELEWLSLSDWTAEGAKNFPHIRKSLATLAENPSEALSAPTVDVPPRIKFKRLDKTARHIMQALDDKKKVRRAKFYYLTDRMNSLKKR